MLSRFVSRPRCRVALLSLLAVALVCGAWADAAVAQTSPTVLICEATGNPSAPYVEIRISQSDLNNYSAGEGDIIPAPAGGCPTAAGSVAPTETSATATTTASTTAATTTSSASPTTTAAAPKKHKAAGSGTKASTTHLAPTNPVDTSSTATAELTPAVVTTSSATTTTTAATSLPFTGGHVPLTLALGLLALIGGATGRWLLIRTREARPPR